MQKPLSDLYAALCARAQEPAPEGARALYIAGRRCGWATHAACDALRDAPETQSDGTALRIGERLAPGNALQARLNTLNTLANAERQKNNGQVSADTLMQIRAVRAQMEALAAAAQGK